MVHRSESELTLDEILFEKRNKSYGAFEIRSIYNSYLKRSMLIGTAVFSLAIASPKIASLFKGEEVKEEEFEVKEVILAEPPPIDPKTTPPPPPPNVAAPTPPKIASTEFLPPKIMEDEKVIVEKEPPTQTELHNTNPGAETQKGETENLNEIVAPANTGNKEVGDADQILLFVGEPPVFQGDYIKFLRKNLQYPTRALENNVEGKVHIKFVVEKDGSITDIKITKGVHPDCDKEAIRVVKLMDQKWTVGKNNGVPARVWKNLFIEFKIPK